MTTLAQAVQAVDEARAGLVADIRNKGVTIADDATLNDCRVGVQNIQAGGDDVQGLVFNDTRGNATEAKVVPPTFFFGKTSVANMLYNCSKLLAAPLFNTSTITNFDSFLYGLKLVTQVPQYDTSKGVNFNLAFANLAALTSFPDLDFSQAQATGQIFSGNTKIKAYPPLNFPVSYDLYFAFRNNTALEEINLTIPKIETFNFVFANCKALKKVVLAMGNLVKNMGLLFQGCKALVEVLGLNFGTGGKIYDRTFSDCVALVTLTITGNIKRFGNGADTFIDFSPCVALSHESLLNIINALEAGTDHAPSLKLGTANEAKLTPEELQLITTKGWTLAQ